MKKPVFLLLPLMLIIAFCADSREYNPFGPAVRPVKPESEQVLKGCPLFRLSTDEAPLSYILACAYDSILVVSLDKNEFVTGVFDISRGELVGKYIHKGRGPMELLSFSSTYQCWDERDSLYLNCFDVSGQNNFVSFNITAAVKDGEIKLRRIGEFIPVTLNARKADDSTNVYYRLTDNTMALERFTKNGHLLNSWKLFPDIPMTNFSIMSFGLALSDDGTKAAIAMTAFPCLNILDMVTGERKSVTFARRIGFESVYDTYRSSFTYPEISSCCGTFTSGNLVCVRTDNVGDSNGDAKSALLIFDWDGNLKYRLLISEDLATYGTVFDPVHKKMYCCTEDDDTLYCYDLSGYL